ncbi:OprD family porin [Klebsiella variicola]|uniref:OprD family porin n=1 Tax=Klebsiella variicola TaxID=244366 RepID=UPI001CF1DBA9|nr:OprD family porin [Klebsiella variicola]MCB3487466.1 hypothetical protein [Klebsiella variicola]HBX9980638.1 hypothetical protein [Klebsiella variicola]HCQ8972842.1 hypothetical protein [Klebsiella variicola]HCY3427812.1 hypothetical protein [Klebsiella variicola]
MSTGYPLQTELRHSQNREDGKALYGDIDNKSYGAMTTLTIAGMAWVSGGAMPQDIDGIYVLPGTHLFVRQRMAS